MLNHNLIKKIFDELAWIHHKERLKKVLDELNEFKHRYWDCYHDFYRRSGPKIIQYVYTSTSFYIAPDKYTSCKQEGHWDGECKYMHTAPNDSILYIIWKDGKLIEKHTVDLLAEGEKKN